ncbi:hypothetical protein [Paracoccus sp. DMF]|uniref:hypothetical protein n=1 Tax=Paracoccus sp. DMF TaxID=400837 RepID=UPI0021E460B4|nr:hypothetical protein [Paracoccus sp. DMF]MCV2448479.1 hypothetical protein [Paracoccus sp. DMF]
MKSPFTRIPRPADGSAPGMPQAKSQPRQRKRDVLDDALAVTARRPGPVCIVPRLVLPWPGSTLWPNRSKGRSWRVSYADKRALIRDTAEACVKAGLPALTLAEGPVRFRWIACSPARRRWDDDGLAGAMKHARDTIARALGVDDSRFSAEVVRGERCLAGAVLVEIEVTW